MNDRIEGRPARRPSRRRILVESAALLAIAYAGIPRPAEAAGGDQGEWRFCSKCASMFWNGGAQMGVCPAGGAHAVQGFQFSLHFDDAAADSATVQYGWRYCSKCRCLFYDGEAAKGPCAAGGRHLAQGYHFGLTHDAPAGQGQTEWRFCIKCFTLFWNGGATKGRCPARGEHTAQGFTFSIPYKTAENDPAAAISDALANVVTAERGPIQDFLKQQLGRADLLKKGYTLYDLNLRLGQPAFEGAGTSFSYKLLGNYLYLRSTTPTVVGSYGDPAFEIHFDVALVGTIVRDAQRVHVEGLVASVPRILVKPRNVSGGLVTTFVHFFEETGYGNRAIQQAVDKYLRLDLTDKVNGYLQRV